MRCEGANALCCVRALLGACVMSYMHATGGARGKALRPPASVGAGAAVVIQRCGPAYGTGGKALQEGVT